MSGNTIKALVGIGVTILTGLGLVDLFEHRETNKKIGMSLKELKDASKDCIKESLVDAAVESAAETAVNEQLTKLREGALASAKVQMYDEVRKAVTAASSQIKKEVSDRISTEASMIDMTALKKSAREKAEEKILNKFDGNLEDLLSKFNDNLGNIQKIYGGIADAISKGRESDKSFKISL